LAIDSLVDMINLPTDFTLDLRDARGEKKTGQMTLSVRMVVDKEAVDAAERKRDLSKTMDLTPIEKWQKRIAVIDIMAAEFSQRMISEVIAKTMLYYKSKVKTKHDYMLEHKRDLHMMKHKEEVEEIDYDDLDGLGNKYAALGIESYPSPYLREYQKDSFHAGMKLVHHKFENFKDLVSIDLSGQRIGLKGMEKLVEHVQRSPLKVLSLTDNDLRDNSMVLLAGVIRQMNQLEQLYLNQNRFSGTCLSIARACIASIHCS
jgi:hypothetical protein